MKQITLQSGEHPAPFDAEGNATMCVQEYASYLAGEPHSDAPKCVSPVLTRFMVAWNDTLDDETRQKLRPYAVRQLGTAGDGQDEARFCMALDWIIRTYSPAFLDAAGLTDEAAKLRGLATIEGIEQAQAAGPKVAAARDAARDAASAAARDAASAAARDAASAAVRDAAYAAARAVVRTAVRPAVRTAAYAAAYDAARATAYDAAYDAAAALAPTIASLQESAFELLDRMIDPAGLHDIPTEAELFEKTGREPLLYVN